MPCSGSVVVVSERRCAGVPSAGILTPVMVTDGGLGTGSSFPFFQPRMEPMPVNISRVESD